MSSTTILPVTSLVYAISAIMDRLVLNAAASTTNDVGTVTSLVTASLISNRMGLFLDQELVQVIGTFPDSTGAGGVGYQILRGQGGSSAQPHSSSIPVWIGNMDSFYKYDPKGRPRDAVLVSPWINTTNGNIWFPQGDSEPGATARYWQLSTNTPGIGPLGVRTLVSSPGYGT